MRARAKRLAVSVGAALTLAALISCELLVPAELSCRAGSVCAPPVPNGWTGPLTAYYGDPSAEAGCPPSMPQLVAEGGFDLDAGPAECTCSCGPPAGESCGTVTLSAAEGPGCGPCLAPPPPVDLVSGVCTSIKDLSCGPALDASRYINVTSTVVGPGSCESRGAAIVPDAAWACSAIACAADNLGTCGSGGSCVPIPPAGFLSRPCIASAGDELCPAGPYTDKHVLYGGVEDGRGCTSCSCGPASGTACSVALAAYAAATGCGPGMPSATGPGCVHLHQPGAGWVKGTFEAGGGSCPADGGRPAGTASPSQPTTLCCVP